jgi:hypothetical protein
VNAKDESAYFDTSFVSHAICKHYCFNIHVKEKMILIVSGTIVFAFFGWHCKLECVEDRNVLKRKKLFCCA